MKLNLFIKKKRNLKNNEKFFKCITSLNPKTIFEQKDDNPTIIFSNLSIKDLCFLKIPKKALFTEDKFNYAHSYGFVSIIYKSETYTVWAKGLGKRPCLML